MNRMYFSIFSLFASVVSYGQNKTSGVEKFVNQTSEFGPYPFRTLLNGGYSIILKIDSSLEFLYLYQDTIIAELSTCSSGLPYKNLGYIGADFTQEFVLVHSFGSGNPHYIELINKADGKNILYPGATWIDADTSLEFLLYCKNDNPQKGDSIILRNIKNKKEEKYPIPYDIFTDPMVLDKIKIKSISKKYFTMIYYINEEMPTEKIKSFRRNY